MSGLEQEFPGAVVARNLDATTDEAKKVIEELGFNNHGLVVRQGGEVRFKQADHEVVMDDVRRAVGELVRGSGGQ